MLSTPCRRSTSMQASPALTPTVKPLSESALTMPLIVSWKKIGTSMVA